MVEKRKVQGHRLTLQKNQVEIGGTIGTFGEGRKNCCGPLSSIMLPGVKIFCIYWGGRNGSKGESEKKMR